MLPRLANETVKTQAAHGVRHTVYKCTIIMLFICEGSCIGFGGGTSRFFLLKNPLSGSVVDTKNWRRISKAVDVKNLPFAQSVRERINAWVSITSTSSDFLDDINDIR